MNNFQFHNPVRYIFGKNTIPEIGTAIKDHSAKRILLIAGGGSIRQNGVYDTVIHSLKQASIDWTECWGVRPNPVLSKVEEAVEIAKKYRAEGILAVGGGSVIDTAKAVAGGFYRENPWDMFEDKKPVTKALPIFTILTLSATGSEMNPYAVITHETAQKKWNMSGPAIYPKVSIVDPSVQFTLPWSQTVNGAIDSLSHTYELYFGDNRCETTLALNESLCRTIISATDKLQNNQQDYTTRANLAWASTLALNGISGVGQGGGDWATHGLEHAVSALYPHIAHGAGLGIIFPAWIEYCQCENPGQFRRWAEQVWKENSVEKGIAAMKQKIRKWKGAVTLKELGVKEESLENIADNANNFGLRGKVKSLTREDMLNILTMCYQ